ncbi:regulatory-associated protein of mTOR-like isoform X1 [Anastrepha obliqua]|uniref:regulatory-associated protein of mTOR-like isoform X1 n=1 Tax=Anastrepha obliqua TaxID=95512 RepID=UPI002409D7F6|nr:regulatory-associated protein of mTOR-like isoform X1 [Anastrepha obliqua]
MDSARNYGRLATSFVIGSGSSISVCAGAMSPSSRKTSMSDSQQMLTMLQQLANGSFGIIMPDKHCPLCFQAKRHQEKIEGIKCKPVAWRIRERMKTASVVLVLCLNIGVDPPDVVKIQPCARLECWVDPSSVSAPKAMELIGSNLQMQYERWQPRARYKKCHDPTAEDVKKLCTSLRRNAKGERILFHYNGHGVPKPTANGEIWVFNKTFTQYIPLSIFELQSWMGAPSIYVYDCSNAGIIINSFQQFAEQHERDLEKSGQRIGSAQPPSILTPLVSYKNCIHLAACSVNEILPMNANLPADLFTSCLTTPINIALKWYTMQEKFELVPLIQSEQVDKIPGKVNDRRTMMGELNWIFTAITDTIAWNTLPRDLFQRLFRQDLLVASLFRNFLLAERILRSHDCTPVSHPALPPCFRHHMWSAWDLVVDYALQQLPEILEKGAPYRQLPFFEQQLTAFQVWLDRESESRSPPEQLPIVLQVLLSQVHRLRALELLARFLDLGAWAVNLALGVGIFPYVLKLLQSSAKELRPVLVFIWAKILAVDPNCQVDLVKEHKYFLSVLQDTTVAKEYRTLSAFVLACIVNDFLLGKTSALQGSLVSICLEQLNDESWLLRQWLAICLGMLWQNFEKARWSGVRDLAHEKLYPLLKDPIPEVRAAAVFALGTFISSVTDREEHANNIDRIIAITLLDTVGEDMSPLVRLELAAALQWMVLLFESQFVTVYMQEQMCSSNPNLALATTSVSGSERSASVSHGMAGAPSPAIVHHSTHSLERHVSMRRGASSSSISNMVSTSIPFQSIFLRLWQGIYNLGHDPFPEVAETAQKIIAYVRDKSVDLITAKEATSDKCNSSVSLPPSPSTRGNFLGGESPPVGGGVQIGHQNSSNWATKLRNNKLLTTNVMNSSDHQSILQRKLRTTSMGDETDSCGPLNGSRSAVLMSSGLAVGASAGLNMNTGGSSGGGDGSHSARSSTSENNYETKSAPLKPILQTEFISWANSYFMRPGKNRYASAEGTEGQQVFPADTNSPELRSRHFRFHRNELIRRQSKEQHMRGNRIDTQTCMLKTQHTPAIVKLLPFETQLAVAYREKVLVYDWVRNSVRSYVPQASSSVVARNYIGESSGSSSSPSAHMQHHQQQYLQQQQQSLTSRVSAIEFLNAHDIGLILAGHEDGIVRVWQPGVEDQTESQLITAFEGLPAMNAAYTSSYGGSGSGTGSGSSSLKHRRDLMRTGIVTAWQQWRQHLVVGGGVSRYLRIWDVERELKYCDMPIGSETSVRVLAPFSYNLNSSIVVAGCGDGSVRLFDKRLPPQEARICVFREHIGAILSAFLKENQPMLVTGCTQGRVRVFDLRQAAVVSSWEAGSDVAVIASHPSADLVACGSAQGIAIYQENGRALNTLRGTEGFMGTKIGYPTCLSFHPYKAALAVGCVDNTVVVYEPAAVL